jgi:TonB family protein
VGAGLRIVFDEDGFPRELIDASDRERAILDEALTPNMSVTVYRDGAPPGVQRAGDIPELRPLFKAPAQEPAEADEGPAPSAPTAPQFTPRAVTAKAVLKPAPSQPVAVAPTESVPKPTAQAATEPSAPPPAPASGQPDSPYVEPDKTARNVGLWVVLGIIVVLYLIGRASNQPGAPIPTSTTNPTTDTSMGMDTNMTMDSSAQGPAEVSAEERAASVSRFLVRETNVRAQASANSASIAMLARGEALQGVLVQGINPQYRWFKITSGPNTGYFVAESNLSDQARPDLDTSFSGRMTVWRPVSIMSEPFSGSQVLDMASAGLIVNVVGLAPNGMAELSLRTGRIGYIDSSAFEGASDQGEAASPASPPSTYSNPPQPAPQQYSAPAPPPSPGFQSGRPQLISGTLQISDSDYPDRAIRNGEHGVVSYVVTVGTDGRPLDCRITQSSGSGELDQQTCRLVRARARFRPSIGTDGKPRVDTYDGAVTWRLD